jgi:hypothetical protein
MFFTIQRFQNPKDELLSSNRLNRSRRNTTAWDGDGDHDALGQSSSREGGGGGHTPATHTSLTRSHSQRSKAGQGEGRPEGPTTPVSGGRSPQVPPLLHSHSSQSERLTARPSLGESVLQGRASSKRLPALNASPSMPHRSRGNSAWGDSQPT